MVDFFSKLVYINVKTSAFAQRFLSMMFDVMDERSIPTLFENLNTTPVDDMWIFKQKISLQKIPPFLLQDVGNEIFPIMFVYIMNFAL